MFGEEEPQLNLKLSMPSFDADRNESALCTFTVYLALSLIISFVKVRKVHGKTSTGREQNAGSKSSGGGYTQTVRLVKKWIRLIYINLCYENRHLSSETHLGPT